MEDGRVQIPFNCSEELARVFDEAHDRLGYLGLSESVERLLLLELKRPHALIRHGNRP